jgi:hypothetical protein
MLSSQCMLVLWAARLPGGTGIPICLRFFKENYLWLKTSTSALGEAVGGAVGGGGEGVQTPKHRSRRHSQGRSSTAVHLSEAAGRSRLEAALPVYLHHVDGVGGCL